MNDDKNDEKNIILYKLGECLIEYFKFVEELKENEWYEFRTKFLKNDKGFYFDNRQIFHCPKLEVPGVNQLREHLNNKENKND